MTHAGTKAANTPLRLARPIMIGSLIFSPDTSNSAEYDTGNSGEISAIDCTRAGSPSARNIRG